MEREVADYILTVLNNTPLEVRGESLARVAALHAQAVEAINEAIETEEVK